MGQSMMQLRFASLLVMVALSAQGQDDAPYKTKPRGHERNQQFATSSHGSNLRKHAGQTNILILPGLVADKRAKRVEVIVERSAVADNAPCEFMVVGEASDHGYEALLIAFAKPSDIHRALQFIGTEPGEPVDPAALRFWAKGESFILSIVGTNGSARRIESLLMDRRTGRPLPEDGFMFTGSKMLPTLDDRSRRVYAADEFQPKAIVSLFNSPHSVLEVPRSAAKDVVYQNTTVNPDQPLEEGALLTLVIEPVNKDGSKRVKDLVLRVEANAKGEGNSASDVERLAGLRLQLKDSGTVLNRQESLVSVVESLARLDRKTHDHFLEVRFADGVALGQAQALAEILSTIDREQGVRIEPPARRQLYYRAFTPNRELLDRAERLYHPWELSLMEKDGRISGTLLLVDSVWKEGSSRSELAFKELPVASASDLRRELDAEKEQARQSGKRARPPVLMVFAPSRLGIGQLSAFLEPVLPTHRAIHIFLDEPAPPVPAGKSAP